MTTAALAGAIICFLLSPGEPPVPAEAPRAPTIHGTASWYEWKPGEAAAGPALRDFLGPDWRGISVKVCTPYKCVTVILTDWCQCYRHQTNERLIDLDWRSFRRLAEPSAGIVKVTISPAPEKKGV